MPRARGGPISGFGFGFGVRLEPDLHEGTDDICDRDDARHANDEPHGRDREIIDAELEGEKASPDGKNPPEERIANAAASEFCVPEHEMDSFIKRKSPFFSDRDVLGLAKRLQVHPGVVAGQLRRRLDKWSIFSKMLVRVRNHALSGAVVDGWGQIAPVSL